MTTQEAAAELYDPLMLPFNLDQLRYLVRDMPKPIHVVHIFAGTRDASLCGNQRLSKGTWEPAGARGRTRPCEACASGLDRLRQAHRSGNGHV